MLVSISPVEKKGRNYAESSGRVPFKGEELAFS
jgi:hypothetical protein